MKKKVITALICSALLVVQSLSVCATTMTPEVSNYEECYVEEMEDKEVRENDAKEKQTISVEDAKEEGPKADKVEEKASSSSVDDKKEESTGNKARAEVDDAKEESDTRGKCKKEKKEDKKDCKEEKKKECKEHKKGKKKDCKEEKKEDKKECKDEKKDKDSKKCPCKRGESES